MKGTIIYGFPQYKKEETSLSGNDLQLIQQKLGQALFPMLQSLAKVQQAPKCHRVTGGGVGGVFIPNRSIAGKIP